MARAVAPPAAIAEALNWTREARGAFGSPLYYFTSIGSTNDAAASLAEDGASEGTTVVAEAQTAGRGRLGRTWFSPSQAGLYVSLVIRPDEQPERPDVRAASPAGLLPASTLTLAAGVALAEAVREATGLAVEVKWPNDLVFRRWKLAGILAEAVTRGDALAYIIVGFGLNIRAVRFPPEVAYRATTIEGELGRTVDRGLVFARLLVRFADCREALRRGALSSVLDRWRMLSPSAAGSEVEWHGPRGPVKGRTAGLDADGALLVKCGDRTERIVAGEVIWL